MRKSLKFAIIVLILLITPKKICFAEIAWERVYEAEVDGKRLSGAYFGGITRSIPAFVDIDGDNDYDMFYGAYYGRLLYFRNEIRGPKFGDGGCICCKIIGNI